MRLGPDYVKFNVGPKSNFVTSRTHVPLAAFSVKRLQCWRKSLRRKNMPATFRKLVIAMATVVAIAGTTVGSAEARWGWRGGGWGWGGFGVGLGTGLLVAAAARPYYGGYYGYGYPAYGYGYRYAAYCYWGERASLH